ncbi:MAG TPA: hypothetical protein VGP50_02710 [Stellaceae bacterium]|jgi:hypothetical protein|nr:hypothetical protein [Stellaceae bacterium]
MRPRRGNLNPDAGRLDWYSVHLAETLRDGVPVQVTRPVPY